VAAPLATTAFVWAWLPGATEPIVAGRLDDQGQVTTFRYAPSYLRRSEAIPLYLPELPLVPDVQAPELLRAAGCILDVGPDAWGRRVIERRRASVGDVLDHDVNEVTYLLESASDRTGALDFQSSSDTYEPRGAVPVDLDRLLEAAEWMEGTDPLPPELDLALLHGTSVGGARPKATLRRSDAGVIAKFPSSTDVQPTVKLEHLAMTLARQAGMEVAPVELVSVAGKDVLLVERFDRRGDGTRRGVVSARTILRLTETGIGASYSLLADEVRRRFQAAEATVHELFARMTFNVLVGNTDDHARNHAAFWDGELLTLTPAFDIEPRPRRGREAGQAMAVSAEGANASQLALCVHNAGTFLLAEQEARAIIDHQISTIRDGWDAACDASHLSEDERSPLLGRQFLNPYAFEGY
jgi:serine/threonine-protein kinase HipA